ncbi:tetratricopeptide repeat protein [Candidatus Obscuribacterales bacterium]|nr:tetratricopeptide repeat protein [Candidatus Obscuribacterales bacterium]
MVRRRAPGKPRACTVTVSAVALLFAACQTGLAQTEVAITQLRGSFKNGRYADVKATIDQRIRGKVEKLSIEELDLLARSEFWLGNYDRFIELAQNLKPTSLWKNSTENGSSFDSWYLRALVLRKPEEARGLLEQQLKEAIAANDMAAIMDCRRQLGDTLFGLKLYKEARKSFEQALENATPQLDEQEVFLSIEGILKCNDAEHESSHNEKILTDAIAQYGNLTGKNSELSIQLRIALCKLLPSNKRDSLLTETEGLLANNDRLLGFCPSGLNELALLYQKEARFDVAKRLFQKARILSNKLKGVGHRNSIQIRNNEIDCLFAMKDYETAMSRVADAIEALPSTDRVKQALLLNKLCICFENTGQDKPQLVEDGYKYAAQELEKAGKIEWCLTSKCNLAQFYIKQRSYQAALVTLNDAIQQGERTQLDNKWTLIKCLSSRASANNLLKKFPEAEKDFRLAMERAAAIQPIIFDAKCKLLQNAARFYLDQDKYPELDDLLSQIRSLIAASGADHYDELSFCCNLEGISKLKQKKPREAEALFTKALELTKKVGNANTIRATQTNIAHAYRDSGKFKEEEALRRTVVETLTKDTETIDLPRALKALAYCLWSQERHQDAMDVFQRAASGFERVNADAAEQNALELDIADCYYAAKDDLNYKSNIQKLSAKLESQGKTETAIYANCINRLGVISDNDQQYAQAKELYEKALKTYEGCAGSAAAVTIQVMQNLANLANRMGNKLEAERIQKSILARIESKSGVSKVEIAEALDDMADQLESNQETQKEVYLKRALELREAEFGANDLRIAMALNRVGACISRQNRDDESEPFYKRALSILETGKTSKEFLDQALITQNLGHIRFGKENYEEALKCYARAAKIRKEQLGEKDFLYAESMLNTGQAQQRLQQYDNAVTSLKAAISIMSTNVKENRSDLATAYDWLGNVYMNQKKYADSETAYDRCLNILKGDGTLDSIDQREKLEAIADAYDRLEDYAEAEPIRRRIVAIREKSRGTHDVDYMVALNNLALNLRFQRKFDQSECLYRQLVSMSTRTLGDNDEKTHEYSQNYGYFLKAAARYKEAIEVFKKELPFYEKSSGWSYAYVGLALADSYWFEGNIAEADDSFRRTLATIQKKHGTDSLLYAYTAVDVAYFFNTYNHAPEAQALLEQALAIRKKQLSPEDPAIALVLKRLGGVEQGRKNFEAAKKHFEESRAIYSTVYGEQCESVASLYRDLGSLAEWQNDYKSAEDYYQKALQTSRIANGNNSLNTAKHLRDLGNFHRERFKYADSETELRACLEMQKQFLKDGAPELLDTLVVLGKTLDKLDRKTEAEVMLKQAVEIAEKVYGANADNTVTAMRELAAILQSQKRNYEASELADRVKSVTEARTGDNTLARADSLMTIAWLKYNSEEYSQARDLAEQALKIRKEKLPADSAEVGAALGCLAAIDRSQSDVEESTRNYLKAIQILGKNQGWQAEATSDMGHELAVLLLDNKRPVEARKIFEYTTKQYIDAHGLNNSNSLITLECLGTSQFACKQYGASELTYTLRSHSTANTLDERARRSRARYNDKARFYASKADLLSEQNLLKRIAADPIRAKLKPALEMLESGNLQNAKNLIDESIAKINVNDSSTLSLAHMIAAKIYGQLGDLQQTTRHCDRACLLAMEAENISCLEAADAIYCATNSLTKLNPKAMVVPNLIAVKNIRQMKLGLLHPLVAQVEVAISLKFGALEYAEASLTTDAANILTENSRRLESSVSDCFGGVKGYQDFAIAESMAVAYLACRNYEGTTTGAEMARLSAKIAAESSSQKSADSLDEVLDVVSFFASEGDYKSANEFFDLANKIVADSPALQLNQIADFKITAGKFCFEKGDFAKAQEYLLSFYDKAERDSSARAFDLGDACELLSACNFHLYKLDKAETFARKSLEFYQVSKKDSYRIRGALVLLGQIAERRLQMKEAKDYYNKCVALREQQADEEDTIDLADAYGGLARCELEGGNIKSARQYLIKSSQYLNSLTARSAMLELVECYNSIARLDASQNQWALSLQFSGSARDTLKNYLSEVFPTLSFSEQHAYVERARQELAASLALCRSDDELDDFYSSVLECRGMLINSLHLQSRLQRRAAEYFETLIPSLQQLSQIRTRLVNLSCLKSLTDEQMNECEGLISQKEAIERQLNAEIGTKFFTPDSSGLSSLRSALKADECFVDIYTFQPLQESESYYHAVIVPADGRLKMVRLGPIEATNRLIKEWREACIRDANARTLSEDDDGTVQVQQTTQDVSELWKQLTNQLWSPIAATLPKKATKVWLAEDGQLARLPWMRMPLSNNKVAHIQLSLINNYKEIIAVKQMAEMERNNQPDTENSNQDPQTLSTKDKEEHSRILIVGGIDFRNQSLTLKKTVEEVVAIAKLANNQHLDVVVLDAEKPTKTEVEKNLPGSMYVHLATHGFAPDDSESTLFSTRLIQQPGAPRLSARAANNIGAIRNPMLQSGLLLAADSTTKMNADRLTAEEILSCDLSACKMAVLSACDTGRGVEVSGQGVLGLRSALMAAGARSIVISLWPVPDDATSALMTEFYKELWSSEHKTKLEALQAAQAIVSNDPKHKEWKSPWYWAGWAIIGEGW